jgi:hypothetical protein
VNEALLDPPFGADDLTRARPTALSGLVSRSQFADIGVDTRVRCSIGGDQQRGVKTSSTSYMQRGFICRGKRYARDRHSP